MSVFARDDFTCQITGKRGNIEAHHIQRYAEKPELRYVVSNGITLDKEFHQSITGKEREYEEKFRDIVRQKELAKYAKTTKQNQNKSYKGRNKYRKRYTPRDPRIRY